jgi:hypothetical protein
MKKSINVVKQYTKRVAKEIYNLIPIAFYSWVFVLAVLLKDIRPCILTLVLLLFQLIHCINSSVKDEGILKRHKRYTRRDSDGNHTLNVGDMFEAIEYLGELEDYFERKGTSYEK